MWRMVIVALDWASARWHATGIAASAQYSIAATRRLRTLPFYGRSFGLPAGRSAVSKGDDRRKVKTPRRCEAISHCEERIRLLVRIEVDRKSTRLNSSH